MCRTLCAKCALLFPDTPRRVALGARRGCSEWAVSPFLYSTLPSHFAVFLLTVICDRRQIMSTKALESKKSREGDRRQERRLRVLKWAAQAGCNRLRQVHVDRTQPKDDGCGVLSRSPGKAEDATTCGAGVGWHVGSHISSEVDLGKECTGNHHGVPHLAIVSQCVRERRQASRIEEACQ